MYHSNGNYEAFVHPSKPEGIENESAYIVGTGLAGLSAAIFLVRDAQVPGENIHILESSPIAGGALDGAYIEGYGYCCRGGRELEDHMECLWDMFRSVPSLENPGMSVLDETYYLNKDDPNYSLERAIYSGGKSATTFDLSFSPRVNQQMQVLMMTPESELDDKPISDFFDDGSSPPRTGCTGARCLPSRSGTPRSNSSATACALSSFGRRQDQHQWYRHGAGFQLVHQLRF